MNKNKEINVSIIGAGKLGTTLAYAITSKNKKNTKIISISSPTQKDLNRAKTILGELSKNIQFTKSNKNSHLPPFFV